MNGTAARNITTMATTTSVSLFLSDWIAAEPSSSPARRDSSMFLSTIAKNGR